ncbi:MAG: histidine phosphatase family protein [Solirubrobacteraceae bacterium]
MRRRIYLMRHGDVAYFADSARRLEPEEVVLTATGHEQALQAGRALAEVRFDRVITSGLERTMQTARTVLSQNKRRAPELALEVWPELQELRSGEVSEIPDDELEESFLGPFRGTPPPTAAYLRGETVGSLVARVVAAMARVFADPGWDTILLVLHGGVNRAILSWALAGPTQLFAQFEQSPGAINIVDGEPGQFVVRAVNLTPYDVLHSGPRTTTVEVILDEYRAFRKAL